MRGNRTNNRHPIDEHRYFGPTVGEKLSILAEQVEILDRALNDVLEATDDAALIRLIGGALSHSKHIEVSWRKR